MSDILNNILAAAREGKSKNPGQQLFPADKRPTLDNLSETKQGRKVEAQKVLSPVAQVLSLLAPGKLAVDAATYSPSAEASIVDAALTHSRDVLLQATKRAAKGESQKSIFNDLGVYRGPGDLAWRSVVSDANARLKTDKLQVNQFDPDLKSPGAFSDLKLPDILEHDELYKVMPAMKDVSVGTLFGLGSKGAYDHVADRMLIPAFSSRREHEVLSTILHEAQHAIQNKSGFKVGGSPTGFLANPELYSEAKKSGLDMHKRISKEWEDAGKPTEGPIAEKYQSAKKLIDNFSKLDMENFDKYERIYGEAEARAVQDMHKNETFAKGLQGPNTAKGSWAAIGTTPLPSYNPSKFPLDYYFHSTDELIDSPLEDELISQLKKGK